MYLGLISCAVVCNVITFSWITFYVHYPAIEAILSFLLLAGQKQYR